MIVYKNLNIKKIHKNSVIAIGNFDGFHLGHQKVLKEAKKRAKKNKVAGKTITLKIKYSDFVQQTRNICSQCR